MDDREIVAAIAAGDLDGLADACGKYAESLFGYCSWMLGEPADAAGAVLDTFVIADGRVGGLADPRKLRPWLYAVARNECLGRLGPDEPGMGEAADPDYPPAGQADGAELRHLVRAALAGLSPGEREVMVLGLQHDLHGADLAAVLGVPRNQAHAIASRARGQLENAVGVLLVARTGRRACPELDLLLDGWDGQMTALTRKRVGRHIDQCALCADRSHGALRPVALYGMAPPPALPYGLREEILRLCADADPQAQAYRRDVTEQAGPFRPNGFPEPARPPRRPGRALAAIAAAAGGVIAIAAAGIVTVLALTGSHAPQPAGGAGSAPGTASASGPASGGPSGPVPPALPPPTSEGAPSASPSATSASASPAPAKPSPSPSPSASSSTLPAPRPTITTPPPRPTYTLPSIPP